MEVLTDERIKEVESNFAYQRKAFPGDRFPMVETNSLSVAQSSPLKELVGKQFVEEARLLQSAFKEFNARLHLSVAEEAGLEITPELKRAIEAGASCLLWKTAQASGLDEKISQRHTEFLKARKDEYLALLYRKKFLEERIRAIAARNKL